MDQPTISQSRKGQAVVCGPQQHSHSAFYGLGFIGAAVYYIHTAAGFGAGVLGILKALVWPAFVVYALMESLHM